jgi:uncharacterized protein with PQ loop repeat
MIGTFSGRISNHWKICAALAVLALSASAEPRMRGPWHLEFDAARAEAEASGRPVLAVFTRTGDCSACERFRASVVGDPAFLAWARTSVVLLDIDDPGVAEFPDDLRRQNASLVTNYARYGVAAVPCALLLRADGSAIGDRAFYGDSTDAAGYLRETKQYVAAAEGGRGRGKTGFMTRETLTQLIGWIPALILPTATLLQLIRLIRAKSSEGVSTATWALFAVANVSLYIFTEKYTAPQAILGMLLTALLNVAIVVLALAKRPARTAG